MTSLHLYKSGPFDTNKSLRGSWGLHTAENKPAPDTQIPGSWGYVGTSLTLTEKFTDGSLIPFSVFSVNKAGCTPQRVILHSNRGPRLCPKWHPILDSVHYIWWEPIGNRVQFGMKAQCWMRCWTLWNPNLRYPRNKLRPSNNVFIRKYRIYQLSLLILREPSYCNKTLSAVLYIQYIQIPLECIWCTEQNSLGLTDWFSI